MRDDPQQQHPAAQYPMSKGTPHRPIRMSDELWARAQAKAAEEGTTASAKARDLLAEWVEGDSEK